MTFEELGRGIGWVGGVLYLIQLIEHTVRQRLFLARVARENRKPRVAPPEPLRIHKLTCELCGENVGSDPYCKHPNALEQPKFIVTALPPR